MQGVNEVGQRLQPSLLEAGSLCEFPYTHSLGGGGFYWISRNLLSLWLWRAGWISTFMAILDVLECCQTHVGFTYSRVAEDGWRFPELILGCDGTFFLLLKAILYQLQVPVDVNSPGYDMSRFMMVMQLQSPPLFSRPSLPRTPTHCGATAGHALPMGTLMPLRGINSLHKQGSTETPSFLRDKYHLSWGLNASSLSPRKQALILNHERGNSLGCQY